MDGVINASDRRRSFRNADADSIRKWNDAA
jgi:hypothetical protein